MKVDIKTKSTRISGYVNAVERQSRPISINNSKYREVIRAGVFQAAITRAVSNNKEIKLYLNHDWSKSYGIMNKDFSLAEDNIGLFFEMDTDNVELIEKAEKAVGWSFGYKTIRDDYSIDDDGMVIRYINELELVEVSIITDIIPVYAATSIEIRADNGIEYMLNPEETVVDRNEIDKVRNNILLRKKKLEIMKKRCEYEQD